MRNEECRIEYDGQSTGARDDGRCRWCTLYEVQYCWMIADDLCVSLCACAFLLVLLVLFVHKFFMMISWWMSWCDRLQCTDHHKKDKLLLRINRTCHCLSFCVFHLIDDRNNSRTRTDADANQGRADQLPECRLFSAEVPWLFWPNTSTE